MTPSYQCIDAKTALDLVAQGATLFDIRDPASFAGGHHPAARRLHQGNLEEELTGLDKQSPVLVCCYHGNSSKSAAEFLASQGFERPCSIDGGWDALAEALERSNPGA